MFFCWLLLYSSQKLRRSSLDKLLRNISSRGLTYEEFEKKIIIAAISLLICLTACDRISNHIGQPIQPEITIGVVLPLSGPLSATGESLQQGINIAHMGHNKFNLIFEDNKGTAEGAAAAFNFFQTPYSIVVFSPHLVKEKKLIVPQSHFETWVIHCLPEDHAQQPPKAPYCAIYTIRAKFSS